MILVAIQPKTIHDQNCVATEIQVYGAFNF
jgi:hypothetical protein